MTKRRSVRSSVGDVVAVPLGDGVRTGFGLLLNNPLVAFHDVCAKGRDFPSLDAIVRSPVAFKIWTMRAPIRDGSWPILGRVEVPAGLLVPTWFFKKDPISGKITIGRNGAEELEPEPGRAQTLERAAVWSASHVVDRLRDHFDGRPNKWVESLRLK